MHLYEEFIDAAQHGMVKEVYQEAPFYGCPHPWRCLVHIKLECDIVVGPRMLLKPCQEVCFWITGANLNVP